ncbi:hypothetical protein N657DRAFT_706495 [Parathielavia appendiculata]|uniref:DSBA-like thioredoxin domain-containing protein n=1 Tax=Parathielavia appendiculata TaxID=2587402 RepID=A0AAN6TTC6_9PEZI|nr:hypothetical protein N657DRAFT_706495 [Parathielavia appendiculata]
MQHGRSGGYLLQFAGRIGNARDSHRLFQLGKTKGTEMENRVVMGLFRSYFKSTGKITCHEMLVEADVKAGIEEAGVREWLESGKGGGEVDAEVQEAESEGIRGALTLPLKSTRMLARSILSSSWRCFPRSRTRSCIADRLDCTIEERKPIS